MSESESSGFDIIERLLREGRAEGRSRTAEGWLADAQRRLAGLRQASSDPRLLRQIDQIETAYTLSTHLIRAILQGKIKARP